MGFRSRTTTLERNTEENASLNHISVVIAQTICVPARSELKVLAETSMDTDNDTTWLLE